MEPNHSISETRLCSASKCPSGLNIWLSILDIFRIDIRILNPYCLSLWRRRIQHHLSSPVRFNNVTLSLPRQGAESNCSRFEYGQSPGRFGQWGVLQLTSCGLQDECGRQCTSPLVYWDIWADSTKTSDPEATIFWGSQEAWGPGLGTEGRHLLCALSKFLTPVSVSIIKPWLF